jgi:Protein of unknown function (DUF3592)
MKLFWRGFCLLLIAVFVWFGLQLAKKLWFADAPRSAFVEVPGTVVEVIRHVISSHDGAPPQHLAEVKFIYTYSKFDYSNNTLSPLCTYCAPQDVVNALGQRPSQISTGKPVQVLVKKDNPKIAYLTLPTAIEFFEQLMFTLLFLLVAPSFAFWMLLQVGKPSESSEG